MKAAVKITVAEWREFLGDPAWPEGQWVDDTYIAVRDSLGSETAIDQGSDMDPSGYENFLPNDTVVIYAGDVFPSAGEMINRIPLKSYFKRWREKNVFEVLTVRVPRGSQKAEKLRDYLRKHDFSFV